MSAKQYICSTVSRGEGFSESVEGVTVADAEAYFRNVNRIKAKTPVYCVPAKTLVDRAREAGGI